MSLLIILQSNNNTTFMPTKLMFGCNKEVRIRRRYNWIFLRYFLFSYLLKPIYSPNDSYRVKLRYEIPCYRSLFNISSENFNLELNHVPGIKVAESCRAGGNPKGTLRQIHVDSTSILRRYVEDQISKNFTSFLRTFSM